MISENNRIKYAFLLDGWSFEHGDKQELSAKARKIIPKRIFAHHEWGHILPCVLYQAIKITER